MAGDIHSDGSSKEGVCACLLAGLLEMAGTSVFPAVPRSIGKPIFDETLSSVSGLYRRGNLKELFSQGISSSPPPAAEHLDLRFSMILRRPLV